MTTTRVGYRERVKRNTIISVYRYRDRENTVTRVINDWLRLRLFAHFMHVHVRKIYTHTHTYAVYKIGAFEHENRRAPMSAALTIARDFHAMIHLTRSGLSSTVSAAVVVYFQRHNGNERGRAQRGRLI